MRALKYAILGLLNQKSMTGYDLSTEFESALKEFWHAKHSQIYPELKKLTDEGMITYEIAITGTVMEKKVYTITEAGRASLIEWLSREIPLAPTPKDNFRLQVFFSNNLPLQLRIDLFKNQLRLHKERLNYLKTQMEKFDGIPDKFDDAYGDYMVLTGAIMREETTCKWMNDCIKKLGK